MKAAMIVMSDCCRCIGLACLVFQEAKWANEAHLMSLVFLDVMTKNPSFALTTSVLLIHPLWKN